MVAFLKKHKDMIVYIVTILFSILYIVVGSQIAGRNFYFGSLSALEYSAEVTSVLDVEEETYALEGADKLLTNETVTFEARITSGAMSGTLVTATQQRDSILVSMPKRVEPGDPIVLAYSSSQVLDEEGNSIEDGYVWTFSEYNRIPSLVWLALAFFAFLLLFGRKNGFNTIVSLVFTCLAVFVVFVPSILSGYNIYISAAITCLYIIVMTLLIVVGATKKGICAAVGCAGGIAVTAVLTLVMSGVLHLTGMSDEQSIYIMMMESVEIDLKALLFGAILVGAVGAVMDVSMSLSSSLLEVSEKMGERRNFKELFHSGMTIGRDIMGTMANTLILAYIGSSLSVVLLMVANESSFLALFNREMIVEEIMQALAGSFGILFTIPLTSLFAAWLYTRKNKANRA